MPDLRSLYLTNNRIQNRGFQFILEILLNNISNYNYDTQNIIRPAGETLSSSRSNATNASSSTGTYSKHDNNTTSDLLGINLKVLEVSNCFLTSYNVEYNLASIIMLWLQKLCQMGFLGNSNKVSVPPPNPEFLGLESQIDNIAMISKISKISNKFLKNANTKMKKDLLYCQHALHIRMYDNILSLQEKTHIIDFIKKCDLTKYIVFEFEGIAARSKSHHNSYVFSTDLGLSPQSLATVHTPNTPKSPSTPHSLNSSKTQFSYDDKTKYHHI